MTKRLPTISLLLCLLPLAGCTLAPKPPTPPPTAAPRCPLTPCRLPARPAPQANEDWGRAVDVLEAELLSCAGQVLDCRRRQAVDGGKL